MAEFEGAGLAIQRKRIPILPKSRQLALFNKYIQPDENGKMRALEPNSTLGKADGPYKYRPELDCEVPTYVSPRNDLMQQGRGGAQKYLYHHVPFCFRGAYKLEDLPKEYFKTIPNPKCDEEGYALCIANSKSTNAPCRKYAWNRVPFCQKHGGALHPADKKITSKRSQIPDPEKQQHLTRVDKIIMGIIPILELSDEEIVNAYVLDDNGKPVSNTRLGQRLQQEMTKELFQRMNNLMQKSLPEMIETMSTLATSPSVEPADRIKAATWMAERILGKTPNVVVVADAGKTYERIFDSVDGGTRDDFRKARAIESTRVDEPGRMERLAAQVAGKSDAINAEVVEEDLNEDNFSDEEVEDYFENREEYESEGFNHAEAHQNSEHYNATSLRCTNDDGQSGDGNTSTDPNPGYSYAARAEQERKRIEQERKEARERIKKSRNRRYAMRASGQDGNEPMWLIDYGPYREIQIKGEKHTVRHARLILPDAQSPAIVDRVTERYAAWETERAARLAQETDNGEG